MQSGLGCKERGKTSNLDQMDCSSWRDVKRLLLSVASGEVGRAQHWQVGSWLQFQPKPEGIVSMVLISYLQLVISGRYE